jgi:hypothetical protein
MKHPNVEVGTDDGFIIGAELSSYDDGEGNPDMPYINLEIEE